MGDNNTILEGPAKSKFKKRIAIFGLIFILANVALFIVKSKTRMSGYAISEISSMSAGSLINIILFVVEIVAVVIFVIFLYARHLSRKKSENVHIDIKEFESFKNSKSGTDFDVLYSIVQAKGEISLSTIVNLFKVSKEKALKWCKILEEHNLAAINYPAFSEPVLKKKEEIKII